MAAPAFVLGPSCTSSTRRVLRPRQASTSGTSRCPPISDEPLGKLSERSRSICEGVVTVSPLHTSVPRWAGEPPEVDLTGASYLVLSRGGAGAVVARGWAATIERAGKPLWIHHGDRAERWALALLQAQLDAARVGTRVMIAAPRARRARRPARGTRRRRDRCRGVRLRHLPRTRRIHCPHCGEETVATVDVGEPRTCRAGATDADRLPPRLAPAWRLSRLHRRRRGARVTSWPRLRVAAAATSGEVRTLRLVAPDRASLPSFTPGSHVLVEVGGVPTRTR